jgi:hypothetical protein
VEVSFTGACLTVETTRNMGYYAYMRNIVNSVHSYVHPNLRLQTWLEAVMAMTILQLDLQLPMQSVPITTDVVSSNLDQGEVYNIT